MDGEAGRDGIIVHLCHLNHEFIRWPGFQAGNEANAVGSDHSADLTPTPRTCADSSTSVPNEGVSLLTTKVSSVWSTGSCVV